MSIEPVELLLEGVPESPVFSDLVEAHLDTHGFEVDPEQVDRISRRLEQRIRPASRRPWWIGALVMAAVALLWLWPAPLIDQTRAPRVAPVVSQVIAPSASSPLVERPRRRVEVAPGARVLLSETSRTSVVLVQEGSVTSGSTVVSEKTWLLVTEGADGSREHVVFPDGEAPPPLHEDVWEPSVEDQLRTLRWRSIPTRSLDALEEILENP